MIAVGIANAIGFKSMSGGAKKVFSDDVARQLLGKDWRMPTRAECQELIDNCDWIWTTIDGINGYEVKSRSNGNSIFLSAGGYNNIINERNQACYYWINLRYKDDTSYKFFIKSDKITTNGERRIIGCTIRAVSEIKGIDLGLSVRWSATNIGAKTPIEYGDYFSWGETSTKSKYTIDNYLYYIDGAYRKYNTIDKLTTLELINTDPIIQKVPLWHFVKKHYDESSKTLDIEDIDLKEEELSVLLDKLWRSEENRDIRLSKPTKKLIYKNQYLRDKVFDTIEKGWVYNIDMQILTDDVARATLGGDWRMPTSDERSELLNNSVYTWTNIDGVNGYNCVSRKNNNSIFISASGYSSASGSYVNVNRIGYYWTCAKTVSDVSKATRFNLSEAAFLWGSEGRQVGCSIRPVSPTNGIDLGLSVRWADKNIDTTSYVQHGKHYQWGEVNSKGRYSADVYLFYIDATFQKYNKIDNLINIQLDNTETPIQDIAFWRFIKNNFNETTHTLDTTDFDLEQEEIDAIIDKLWQVTETRTLKVSFATYKLISDEQRAVVESRGWTLVRQDVYQLLDANAENNSDPKLDRTHISYGVTLTRAEGNIITLKGTATGDNHAVARSIFTINAGHKYLVGGYSDKIQGLGYDGRHYFYLKTNTIITCPASYIDTYVSVVIEQGVTYDDVIRPFVIDLTATFANKGQDFIDGLDTADKVAQALGYESYAEMPYFDFNPAPDVQLALANAVMALDFYDAEPEPECLDDLNF